MTGSPRLLLMGSGEFTAAVLPIDTMLRDAAGVHSVAVIPTAAGQEPDAAKWITMAERHYAPLGINVAGVPAFTRHDADDPAWDSAVGNADLIYLSGGDPNYLHDTLSGSRLWRSIVSRIRTGSILAGSSAGAMVLGGSIAKNIRALRDRSTPPEWVSAFAFVTPTIFPHFDRWRTAAPGAQLIHESGPPAWMGIDEDTGVFITNGVAQTLGRGSIELSSRENHQIYTAGSSFPLPVQVSE